MIWNITNEENNESEKSGLYSTLRKNLNFKEEMIVALKEEINRLRGTINELEKENETILLAYKKQMTEA